MGDLGTNGTKKWIIIENAFGVFIYVVGARLPSSCCSMLLLSEHRTDLRGPPHMGTIQSMVEWTCADPGSAARFVRCKYQWELNMCCYRQKLSGLSRNYLDENELEHAMREKDYKKKDIDQNQKDTYLQFCHCENECCSVQPQCLVLNIQTEWVWTSMFHLRDILLMMDW